jgi:heme/copper-type cytochrome/quinol oxidase subunit 2
VLNVRRDRFSDKEERRAADRAAGRSTDRGSFSSYKASRQTKKNTGAGVMVLTVVIVAVVALILAYCCYLYVEQKIDRAKDSVRMELHELYFHSNMRRILTDERIYEILVQLKMNSAAEDSSIERGTGLACACCGLTEYEFETDDK